LETQPWYNPRQLRDLASGRFFADSDYIWSDDAPVALAGELQLATSPDGTASAMFRAQKGGLAIEHTFTLPAAEPNVLLEVIRIHNSSAQPPDPSSFACGFGKRVREGADWLADVAGSGLCELPYRRHPETGELRDFKLPDLLAGPGWYST